IRRTHIEEAASDPTLGDYGLRGHRPGSVLPEHFDEWLEFAEAREAGQIARSGGSAWTSCVPRLPEVLDFAMDRHFTDAFDEGYQAQWRALYVEPLAQALLMIVMELATWGAGAVVSAPATAAQMARAGITRLTVKEVFVAAMGRTRNLHA